MGSFWHRGWRRRQGRFGRLGSSSARGSMCGRAKLCLEVLEDRQLLSASHQPFIGPIQGPTLGPPATAPAVSALLILTVKGMPFSGFLGVFPGGNPGSVLASIDW